MRATIARLVTAAVLTGAMLATGSAEECFGIAPNRTIWHAWPNSGGWKQVGVIVKVNNVGYYCSLRNHGPGWGGWFRC